VILLLNCPLPTAHCPLPTAHCPLPTASSLLSTFLPLPSPTLFRGGPCAAGLNGHDLTLCEDFGGRARIAV